jgi:hypothetical protein
LGKYCNQPRCEHGSCQIVSVSCGMNTQLL